MAAPTEVSSGLKAILLDLSDEALDKVAKEKMRSWSVPPAALEVLEVLDLCARYALTSDLGMQAFQVMLDEAIKREGTSVDALMAQATWRQEGVR